MASTDTLRTRLLDDGHGEPLTVSEPPPPDADGAVERLLRIIRNRKWVILQAIVIVPVLALLLSLAQSKTYSATATLLFRSTKSASGSVDVNRQAATNAKLVALPTVADRTAKLLGVTSKSVRSAVSITPDQNADTTAISADGSTPSKAASYANAYARAFVTFRQQAQEADLAQRLGVYRDYLNSLPATERNSSRIDQLRRRLDQISIQQSLNSDDAGRQVELVQPAIPPTSASSPKTKLNVALGLLLGIAIGFGLAALLERLDRALRSVDELERVYGLPILARIPRFRSRVRRSGAPLATEGVEAEAFRSLRANLRYFSAVGELRTVLVASPQAGDGKSTVAAGLAATMAQMGERVVLVEADLHKPGLARSLPEGERSDGLSSVLAGADLRDALVDAEIDGGDGVLKVLPSGARPPNPSQLIESPRMHEVLEELEGSFDRVIIDSPAMGAVSDSLALVPWASGVILVSRLRHTSRDAALDLRKQLARAEGRMLGVVANETVVRADGYYYGQ